MNVLDAVLDAQGGAAARQTGSSLGLSQDQTGAALAALVPALAAGLQRNASRHPAEVCGNADAICRSEP